jgi:hypothetical protein
LQIFQGHMNRKLIYNIHRSFFVKLQELTIFWIYFPKKNFMDRVYGVWTDGTAWVHGGLEVTQTKRTAACGTPGPTGHRSSPTMAIH